MNPTRSRQPDRILLVSVGLLLLLGIAVIFSASAFWSADRHADFAVYLKRHCARVAIGLALLVLASKIDYHRYRELTPYFVLVIFGLLVAVFFIPKTNGVHRTIPLWGQRFQPAEAMKLMTVFFMAAVLAKGPPPENRSPWKDPLLYYFAYLMVSVFLIFMEPDMGTSMVVFFVGLTLFLIAGVRLAKVARMTACVIPLLAVGMVLKPYQWIRLKAFVQSAVGLKPLPYQIQHSLIALSRGRLAGVGFGQGDEKNLYLPQPFSDFILATLGEELGFIGMTVLLALLFTVLWRGFRIARRAGDQYGFLLAAGITSMILINALINAGVVMHLLPTTGLPFPFISYGGSSLFVTLGGIGVLLNVSKQTVPSLRDISFEHGGG